MKKKIFFFICFLLFIKLQLISQTYSVSFYSVKQGFTGGQPYCIFQDQNGYIWTGTTNGLMQFDGRSFRRFTIGDGLPANLVNCIREDKEGRILISTQRGYCEYYKGKFTKFRCDTATEYSTLAISVLKDGTVVVSASGKGLFYRKDTILLPFKTPLDQYIQRNTKDRLNVCFSLHTATDGTLYAGTLSGLYMYKRGAALKLPGMSTGYGVITDQNGSVYTSLAKTYKYTSLHTVDSFNLAFDAITTNNNSRLLATNGGDLYELIDGRFIPLRLIGRNSTDFGMINQIIVDREGVIWLAAQRGIARLKKVPFIKEPDPGYYAITEKDFYDFVYAQHPVVKPATMRAVLTKVSNEHPEFNNITNGYFVTKDVFFVIVQSGILFYNKGKITSYMPGGSTTNFNKFSRIEVPGDGSIWFTGTNGVVVYKNGRFATFDETYPGFQGVFQTAATIFSSMTDQQGNVWLSNTSGTVIWDGRKFDKFLGPENGLVVKMLKYGKNNQLLSFGNGGLYIISATTDGKRQIVYKNPAISNAFEIFVDSSLNIWHFGKEKIDVLYRDKFSDNSIKVRSYQLSDEIEDLFEDTVRLRFEIPSKDSLIIHSMAYAYRIFLDSFLNDRKLPPIKPFLERIDLYQRETDWNKMGFISDPYNIPKNLILNFSQNFLTFSYKGISTSHPENTMYQVRLKGYDPDWLPVTNSTSAVYSNLPSGEYTFCVRVINPFSANSEVLAYSFIIQPPWWKTWWFYFLAAGILSSFILFLFRWRTRHLILQRVELEGIIQQRTAVLEKKNIELATVNERLEKSTRINEMMSTVLAHDIKGPVRFISNISGILPKKWNLFTDSEKIENTIEINKASTILLTFLTNFLSWIKFRNKETIESAVFYLKPLVDKLFLFHENTGNLNNNIKVNAVPVDFMLNSNEKIVEIILNNIIDNAIKYTDEGQVVVSSKNLEGCVVISCKDTGKGMSQEQVISLLANKNLEKPDYESSFKMGYLFIHDLLKLVHGEIEIHSMPDLGTEVLIKLPQVQSDI